MKLYQSIALTGLVFSLADSAAFAVGREASIENIPGIYCQHAAAKIIEDQQRALHRPVAEKAAAPASEAPVNDAVAI